MKRNRRLSAWILAVIFVLLLFPSGCSKESPSSSQLIFNEAYDDLFDTYVVFTVYGISEDEFNKVSQALHDHLLEFHQETDIYHTYTGLTNLADVNLSAGGEALTVSPRLMDFLKFCRQAYDDTLGKVNVMMGAVTILWQTARETLSLPTEKQLEEASAHTDIDLLVLDEQSLTATLTDPHSLLDVGALAKGYAGRLAKEFLKDQGIENYLLDLGGNIVPGGTPQGTGRDHFVIGLQDPKQPNGSYKETVSLTAKSAVTSGDYQRFAEIDGQRYHHIIDPVTLYPGTLHHSVTILHEDPAVADMLSTALFLMTNEEGLALAEKFDAEVIYQDK